MTALGALMQLAEARAGATDAEISSVERELGVPLPDDHKAVLRQSNGLEGFIAAGSYLMLWSSSEIQSLNEAYAVAEFVPGVVLIGTDGGDTGYGFSWEGATARYVGMPLIGMEPGALTPLGGSMTEFLERIRSADKQANPDKPEPG